MVDLKYGQLFSVELLHEYARDNVCKDFSILASDETKRLLADYRIVTKQFGNILYAGIDLEPNELSLSPPKQIPFILPEKGLRLTFFLVLNNPLFYNYTNQCKANNNGAVYYFTNRNNNASNGKNFLSSPLPAYVSGTFNYEDLVVDGGTTYQSVSGSNTAVLNTNAWRKIDGNRFVSNTDVIYWKPSIFQYAVNPANTSVNIGLARYDGAGNYTQPVFAKTIDNSGSLPSVQIDLSGISNGKYLLSVDGSDAYIYLNDELSNRKVFGVIDIFFENTLSDAYIISDASTNELKSPIYSICFLNRATNWKYILKRTSNAVMSDASNIYQFTTITSPPTATTITSDFPIPLSEIPLSLSLDGRASPCPPCATAERLSMENNNPVFYSEIYLNY